MFITYINYTISLILPTPPSFGAIPSFEVQNEIMGRYRVRRSGLDLPPNASGGRPHTIWPTMHALQDYDGLLEPSLRGRFKGGNMAREGMGARAYTNGVVGRPPWIFLAVT